MCTSNTTQSGAKPSILIPQIQESNVPYGHVDNAEDRSGREDDRQRVRRGGGQVSNVCLPLFLGFELMGRMEKETNNLQKEAKTYLDAMRGMLFE